MVDARWWVMRLGSAVNQVARPLTSRRLARLSAQAREVFADGPVFSVVMPVHEPPRRWLEAAVASVVNQAYPHWELCIADDASPSPWVRDYLTALAAGDARIKVVLRDVNGHISAASNSAAELATGDWLALLDNDDELAPLALLHCALHLRARPDDLVIFSDEDKISVRGWRFNAYRKPSYNQDLMLSQNLISHLGVYRRDRFSEIGGFRRGFEGSQDHDLALRATHGVPERVGHIPHVLYHWRAVPTSTASSTSTKSYALDAGVRAIEDQLGADGRAELRGSGSALEGYRVLPRVPPAADGEVIRRVAADGTISPGEPGRLTVFVGADLTLPDDTGWLSLIAWHLDREGVGAVGGAVLDDDHRIVDGPLWLGTRRWDRAARVRPAWAGKSLAPGARLARAQLTQTVSALSLSFLAVRSDTLEETPLDDAYGSFRDVDLCLRLAERGLRSIYLPDLTMHGRHPLVRRGLAQARALRRRHPRLAQPDANTALGAGVGGTLALVFNDSLGIRAATRGLTRSGAPSSSNG